VCVFFALVIPYANRILYALCHISICGLSGCTMLFHIITNGAIFGKNVIEFKMCVLIFCSYNICLGVRGGVVVKALHYKLAGRGFDSRWCHWNFSVT
jgi:hypothetical protein